MDREYLFSGSAHAADPMFYIFIFLLSGFWGPGAVPLDPERFFMKNGGSGAPSAPTRAPFSPIFISDFQLEHIEAVFGETRIFREGVDPLDPSRKMRGEIPLILVCCTALLHFSKPEL